jgi:3-oxoacyl-[acyl-carrier-protein] synthase II
MKRVVITGVGALSPLGHDWPTVRARLREERNVVRYMENWDAYDGLNTRLGVPVAAFDLPSHYNRKVTRSMGRVAIMACLASEKALLDAGLTGDPLVRSGDMGISYGSSVGSPPAVGDFGNMINHKTTEGINANTYIKMMSHTAAVNIGVFLGATGRIIPTSSACTAGSQGVGYAFEAIQSGRQIAMLAGGAEELDAADAAVFDTLFATSTTNDAPELSPRPFDAARDGLVLGEGACTFVLEEYEHAQARGAHILGEIVGYGTNCDGTHVTQPQSATPAAWARSSALAPTAMAPMSPSPTRAPWRRPCACHCKARACRPRPSATSMPTAPPPSMAMWPRPMPRTMCLARARPSARSRATWATPWVPAARLRPG